MTKRREDSTRAVRSDKRKQFPLRFENKNVYDAIHTISFNTGKPINTILNKLLEEALHDERIINGIYAMYPPREDMIIIKRGYFNGIV